MSDLISRQAAINALKNNRMLPLGDNPAYNRAMRDSENVIRNLPSAQSERETAKFIRWMECKKTANYISYTPHCKCSKCGTEFLIETVKYCYMCGARMER